MSPHLSISYASMFVSLSFCQGILHALHFAFLICSMIFLSVSWLLATAGQSADSPILILPSGAITGVQTLPTENKSLTRSVKFELGFYLAMRMQFAHFGPIVFHLTSGKFKSARPCGYRHDSLSAGLDGTGSTMAPSFLSQYLSLSVNGSG